MTQIIPQPGIMDIALYQGGKAHLEGVADPLKLSSNENPHGASPAAVKAVQDAAFELNRYPSSDHAALRGAIGAVYGLPADQLICGAGSDELIAFMCQCFAGPGDEVIHTQYGFAMYAISARAAGATPVEVLETSRTVDVDAILAACTDKTRLVFIANPSNPTGTFINSESVARLADGLPERAILVLDGAYTEYVEGYDGGAKLVSERSNIFMTRTFSKVYGLGALRVGWGYGPSEIVDVLNRVRGPFNVSAAGLAAAEAAVKDQAFVERCRKDNARGRAWLRDQLQRMGLGVDRPYANFLLVRFKDEAAADACNAFLQKQGLIVRQTGGYQLPNALRITVGDEAGCRRVSHAIRQFLEGAV